MQHIIMIGGTGMLAPAAREVVKRTGALTLIARHPETLAEDIGARVIVMDWSDAKDIERAIGFLRSAPAPSMLISWIHERGMACLPPFENLLIPSGRSIRVHGSAVGDPSHGVKTDPPVRPDIERQNVVLGWVDGPHGRRWLSNEEISGGVLQAFQDPSLKSLVVGEV